MSKQCESTVYAGFSVETPRNCQLLNFFHSFDAQIFHNWNRVSKSIHLTLVILVVDFCKRVWAVSSFFLPSFACEAINLYSSFFGIRYVANVYYFAEYFQILSDKSLRRTAQQCKCSACLKKTHTTQHYDYKKIGIMTKCCAK